MLNNMSSSRKIYAFGTVLLGILLLFWPYSALSMAATASGIVIIGGGVTALLAGLRRRRQYGGGIFNLLTAILVTAFGSWIFLNPSRFIGIIPTVFGYIIVISGIFNLLETFSLTRARYRRWWASLLTAVITILMGLFLINHALGVASMMVRIAGIFLVFNGISDLLIARRLDQYVFYSDRRRGGAGGGQARKSAGAGRASAKYDTSDPDIVDAEDYREM